MRTLVLSDLHIGDPRYENNGLTYYVLNKEPFDRLILNGDVIDLWTTTINTVRKNPILSHISKIAETKEVIWVLGNHDWLARGKNLIPGAIEVESYVIPNTSIICVHGHQVYEFQNMAWYAIASTVVSFFLWKTFGVHLQRFLTSGWLYSRLVRRRRKSVLARYGRHVRTIIMGHTHLFGYCSDRSSQLYDIGSLPIRKMYAVVENGLVWIRKSNDYNQL